MANIIAGIKSRLRFVEFIEQFLFVSSFILMLSALILMLSALVRF